MGYGNVYEVSFGAKSPDRHFSNMRSYMWSRMRGWLANGSICVDEQLEIDLTGPKYRHNASDQLVLESKDDMRKRGLASPDDGDALALTFAAPVPPLSHLQESEHQEYLGAPFCHEQGAWMR